MSLSAPAAKVRRTLAKAAPSKPAPSKIATPKTANAAASRDPFFDNSKFLLIALVVCGHSWSPVQHDIPAARALYSTVYLFHMPAFILICGYFSRGFAGRPEQLRALATKVLVPYLLFQTAYRGLERWIDGGPFEIQPTEPTYMLWFLLALCLWRLSAPLWQAVRYPVAIAVLVSLAAGTTRMGYDLALPRVLMFLPWFVLGLRLRPEYFARLRVPAVRRAAPVLFAATAAAAYWLAPHLNTDWFNMRDSNTDLGVSVPVYLGVRVLLFVLSGALVAAFFALVPTRTTRFTALGAVTMFPFLAHGLVIQTAEKYDLDVLAGQLGAGAAPLLAVTGLGLTLLLSSTPVRRVLRPLVEPRFRRSTGSAESTEDDRRTSGVQ
ncbi:acyltransferase family protein [Streptomyces sp. NPDC002851]